MKRCPRCGESKAIEQFPLDPKAPSGRYGYCKDCKSAYMRERHLQMKADGRQFKENLMRSLRKFSLTWEWWLNHPQLCEICGGGPTGPSKRLVFDHDHATGKFRGVLCGRCNSILGYVDDNPEVLRKAAAYLENSMKEQANVS